MSKSASKNPAYPTAHPTAPGGMSQAALVVELVEKHDYDRATAKAMTWPEQIEAVINGRLANGDGMILREDADLPEWDTESTPVDPAYGEENDDLDIDALLAEFEDDEVAEPKDTNWPAFGKAMETGEWSEDVTPGSLDIPDGVSLGDEDGVFDPEQMFAEMAAARDEATPPPLFIGLPGIRDYIFDGHAGAGPSGAERWMNCTMSLTASRKFLETLSPNQQRAFAGSNTAARQGTTAHAAAEVEANMILGRATAEEVDYTLMELSIVPEDEGEAYDDEMAEYITEYTDLVKSYAQERGNENVLVESRVEAAIPLTDMHEGEVYIVRGSADLTGLPTKAEPTLVVGDLKYGNGIDVDVDENPQIRIYALGVLELLADPETGELPDWLKDVVYHIVQPRLGGIKTWTESIDDLLEWRDEVLAPALTKALYGAAEGATYEPSELACQWCPARGSCPALTEQRVEAASGLFDVIVESEFENGPGTFPETTSLTDTRLGELLTMAAGLQDIYKDLKEEAQRRLHRGGAVPGYQLVNYTPPRRWKPKAVEQLAEVPVWKDPTMMTPKQALLAVGDDPKLAALVEKFIETPDKRPVIGKEDDRRSKWEGKPPEQMFADESQTGEEA